MRKRIQITVLALATVLCVIGFIIWYSASWNPIFICESYTAIHSNIGPVKMDGVSLEQVVEEALVKAKSKGIAYPSVLLVGEADLSRPISLDMPNATLGGIFREAERQTMTPCRIYAGRVIFGKHTHPLMSLIETLTKMPESDPFSPP